MTVRPSAAGTSIRVRLSNRFGDRELKVAHVTAAQPGAGAAITAGTVRDALFRGSRAVTIPVGAEAVSDPVEVAVNPNRDVAISIAVTSSGRLTWHVAGPPVAYATTRGAADRTTEVSGTSYRNQVNSYVLLTGIEVRTRVATRAIVALGDSITDGGGAAPNRRWLDVLGSRLRAAGRPYAVVNAGIACNDLTIASRDGGLRAIDRLKVDVLDRSAVSHVIIAEGTNDIYGGVPAETVIDALSELATRIRASGRRVIGATIIPRDAPIAPARDAERQAVNRWIRNASVFDGVIDFDAVIRSPADPRRMLPAYNGDDIHPDAAGHVAMGDAISLRLFARPPRSPS